MPLSSSITPERLFLSCQKSMSFCDDVEHFLKHTLQPWISRKYLIMFRLSLSKQLTFGRGPLIWYGIRSYIQCMPIFNFSKKMIFDFPQLRSYIIPLTRPFDVSPRRIHESKMEGSVVKYAGER